MKKKLIWGVSAVGLLLIIVFALLRVEKEVRTPNTAIQNLSNHPIYSRYEFDHGENVINMGVQPFYMPTGIISEAMKRDALLREALAKLGMEIKFYPFLKGADVNFFLQRNDLQVGIGGDMPALTAAATMEIVIPTLIQQGFTSIVSHRPLLISELRGKRIGYAFGSNAHYALLQALSYEGLKESDVLMVPLEVSDIPEALANGEVDAFSAWEPTPAITLSKYPDSAVIHRYLSQGYLYFDKTFSAKHPLAVREIVAAQIRAIRYLRSDRDNLRLAGEWAMRAGEDLTGRKRVLTIEQYVDLALRDILRFTSAPFIVEKDLKPGGLLWGEFEFLRARSERQPTWNWERVRTSFDRHILTEVLSNPLKYRLDEFKYRLE
jgi:NitT/TauT family transport system substrate-binding protein